MSELAGKRAVVTGASRGIGREIALTLAAAGAEVALVSRDLEALEAVAAEIGGAATCHVCDLADREAILALTAAVGRVDILVNNAAPEEHYLPITEPGDAHWDLTFAVNFTAPLLLTRELGRAMAAAGGGSIINISTIVAQDPAPLMGAYVCSKAALESLTRLTAVELGGAGVRANAIAPGIVATDLTAALLSDGPTWQALKMAIPLGRAGEVSEVAQLALFLAGPRSSFLSGQVIALDGGARAGQHALLAGMDGLTMALKNRITPETAGPALERWYAAANPGWTDITISGIDVPSANGMSSETVLFDLAWTADGAPHTQALVARVAPTANGLFPVYDLTYEQQVIRAVAASTTVPVPAAHAVEPDPAVLGSPFLVMERLSGRVPADDPPFTASGWVLELSPEDQATLYDNALVAMAAISATDVSGLVGGGTLPDQLARYEALYAWAAGGREHPALDAGFAWIRANLPDEQAPIGLSWGDARVGNMMFGDDLRVTGVLDWEMASPGEAEVDLAWFLFLNRNHTEGMGLPVPPGFPSREATLARYEELLGRPLVNFAFHERFAAVRANVLMMRVGVMMIEAGFLPADATMPVNNPASQLLAEMVGLVASDGPAAWISGRD